MAPCKAMKIVARRQQEKLRGCLMLPLAFVYFVLLPGTIWAHVGTHKEAS